jgi:hypothetical protein
MARCPQCSGSGRCFTCGGLGNVRCPDCNQSGFVFQQCPICLGTGKNRDNKLCTSCGGSGRIRVTCRHCNGIGNFRCVSCAGGGRCTNCGGTGQIRGSVDVLPPAPFASDDLEKPAMSDPEMAFLENIVHFDLPGELDDLHHETNLVQELASRKCNPYFSGHRPLGAPPPSLALRLVSISYGPPKLDHETTVEIDSGEYTNDTDAEGSQSFQSGKQYQAQLSWSVSNSVQTGTNASVTVPTPAFSVTAGNSYSLTVTDTITKTDSVTSSFTGSQNVPVPKRSRVVVNLVVHERHFLSRFDAVIDISGTVITAKRGKLIFMGLGVPFRERPHPEIQFLDDNTIRWRTRGLYSGARGLRWELKAKQFPLTPVHENDLKGLDLQTIDVTLLTTTKVGNG